MSPVTITALTTIVDRQFKEYRTLRPVWALRYYLDRTKDLRGSRSLPFISFKKGHTSDIRPATLSSWLKQTILLCYIYLFIYLGFYVAFNTVQVISRRVVGRAEETSTYSSLGFCTVNCRPTASNYQLSHLRPCRGSNPGLRGGRRESYHSATVAPSTLL